MNFKKKNALWGMDAINRVIFYNFLFSFIVVFIGNMIWFHICLVIWEVCVVLELAMWCCVDRLSWFDEAQQCYSVTWCVCLRKIYTTFMLQRYSILWCSIKVRSCYRNCAAKWAIIYCQKCSDEAQHTEITFKPSSFLLVIFFFFVIYLLNLSSKWFFLFNLI